MLPRRKTVPGNLEVRREARGFAVKLVDARKVKNVSGRKSDVMDCQWIQQLESYGLLAGA